MTHFAGDRETHGRPPMALSVSATLSELRLLSEVKRPSMLGAVIPASDPQETLDVHCGNGFDTRFEPYQSARLSRYNAGP